MQNTAQQEISSDAFTTLRDVGVIALSRRLERLNDTGQRLFARLNADTSVLGPSEAAVLTLAAVAVCREISRLVDIHDPTGFDGIPNLGGADVELTQEEASAVGGVLSEYFTHAEEQGADNAGGSVA